MGKDDKILDELKNKEYEAGFVTDIEMDVFPKGLNEDVIKAISEKKEEPATAEEVQSLFLFHQENEQ